MTAWSSRDVSIRLPSTTARAMWDRARKWDVDAGGRFDARAASILIWSTNATATESGGEPVGAVRIEWHAPTEHDATIRRIEWIPAAGGSEHEVWLALEVLAGRDLRG